MHSKYLIALTASVGFNIVDGYLAYVVIFFCSFEGNLNEFNALLFSLKISKRVRKKLIMKTS